MSQVKDDRGKTSTGSRATDRDLLSNEEDLSLCSCPVNQQLAEQVKQALVEMGIEKLEEYVANWTDKRFEILCYLHLLTGMP